MKSFKVIFLIVFSILFFEKVKSEDNISIVFKVNNEIITNRDVQNEISYLSALNSEFQNLTKDKKYRLAKESILKEGLNNPLCCGNVKQDGTYRVNRGNQCLAALQELNIDTVSCIICCKNNSLNNPKGVEIAVGEIGDLFKSGVERISEVSHPECFEIIPSDHQDFDPTLIMNL